MNIRTTAAGRIHFSVPIFLLALTLRAVYFFQSMDNPLLYFPVLDEAYYIDLGKAISGGHWIGENGAFFMDPLYGYFLAPFFSLFREPLLPIRVFQMVLDSLSAVLVYRIGTELWNEKAGIAAGILYAIYKVAFFHSLLILKTTLTIFLVLFFFFWLLRLVHNRRTGQWFLIGITGGLIVYLHAHWLLMLPLAAIAYGLIEKPGFLSFARNAALFAAGAALVFSASAIRNYGVTGEWIWLNTQSGRLFYSSNNPENLSGRYNVPSFSRPHPEDSETDFHREAERRLGVRLTATEVSGYWREKTLEFLRENPRAALVLIKNKLKETVADYEIPDTHSFYAAARFAELAQWPMPTFSFVLGLGLPGLVLGLASGRRTWWLLAPLLSVGITICLFYSSSRFRMPAVPFLMIGAGIFVERLYEWIGMAKGLRLIVMLLISAVIFTSSAVLSEPRESGTGEFLLAKAYWGERKYREAEREALEGVKRFPGQARFPALLGMVALSEERYEDAIRHNLSALEIEHGYADAFHNLGLAYLLSGRAEEAAKAVETALSLSPNARYLFTLAKARETNGNRVEAAKLYGEYLRRSKASDPYRKDAEKSRSLLQQSREDQQ